MSLLIKRRALCRNDRVDLFDEFRLRYGCGIVDMQLIDLRSEIQMSQVCPIFLREMLETKIPSKNPTMKISEIPVGRGRQIVTRGW